MPTLTGEIADIAFKYTANGDEFVEVSVAQTGRQYPTKARGFDHELVARFHNATKGQRVNLDIEENQGTGSKGNPITFRNIVGILPMSAASDQDNPPAPASPPSPQASRSGVQSPSAAPGAPPYDGISWGNAKNVAAVLYPYIEACSGEGQPTTPAEVLDLWEYAVNRIYNTFPTQDGE